MLIRKVWLDRGKNQLHITIPNNEGINDGDYVEVSKIKSNTPMEKK